MTTLTNDQITAGAAVKCDLDLDKIDASAHCGLGASPVETLKLTAIARRAPSPQVADIAELPEDFRERFKDAYLSLSVAAFASPFWNQSMEELLSAVDAELNKRADAIAASRRASAPASAGQAAPALPEHLREFVEAVAGPDFDYIDRETDERLCIGCNQAARFVGIEEGFKLTHAEDCIVLRAQALLAAQPAEVSAGQAGQVAKGCTIPPGGWYCTRAAGHEGPCAAHPSNAQAKP